MIGLKKEIWKPPTNDSCDIDAIFYVGVGNPKTRVILDCFGFAFLLIPSFYILI